MREPSDDADFAAFLEENPQLSAISLLVQPSLIKRKRPEDKGLATTATRAAATSAAATSAAATSAASPAGQQGVQALEQRGQPIYACMYIYLYVCVYMYVCMYILRRL